MSGLSWSRKDFSNRTYQKMLVNYLVFNTNEFWSRSALVCSKIFPEWLQDQTQRTKYCLQRPQKSKVTKEDTLLLIQIDGQTNWTKEKSDLNESRIGKRVEQSKGDYLMVKVNFAIHMEENILVFGKMGKEMV